MECTKTQEGYTLAAGITESEISDVLNSIKENESKFEIYDSFYPSPSDPGAYICYANYDDSNDVWSMTLGNHGWSGGIYIIESNIVLRQLMHIANQDGSVELRIKNAVFFSHYDFQLKDKNIEMNYRLKNIHEEE